MKYIIPIILISSLLLACGAATKLDSIKDNLIPLKPSPRKMSNTKNVFEEDLDQWCKNGEYLPVGEIENVEGITAESLIHGLETYKGVKVCKVVTTVDTPLIGDTEMVMYISKDKMWTVIDIMGQEIVTEMELSGGAGETPSGDSLADCKAGAEIKSNTNLMGMNQEMTISTIGIADFKGDKWCKEEITINFPDNPGAGVMTGKTTTYTNNKGTWTISNVMGQEYEKFSVS